MNLNLTPEKLHDLILELDHHFRTTLTDLDRELCSLKDLVDQLEQQLRNLRNEG